MTSIIFLQSPQILSSSAILEFFLYWVSCTQLVPWANKTIPWSSLRSHYSYSSGRLWQSSQNLPLVVQWLRICLPMQGTWVRSQSQEDPTGLEAPMPCAATTEPNSVLGPNSRNCGAQAPHLQKLECPRVGIPPKQEKTATVRCRCITQRAAPALLS